MSNKYHLQENVIFYGEKTGRELDDIYNMCNIAIASLGMYKIGYKTANSLKVREYMAKGLPVITGCPVDIMQTGDFKYYYEFPNNDTSIDMNELVTFFDKVYQKKEKDIIYEIRQYAVKYCDMVYAMKPVIDYFKEEV